MTMVEMHKSCIDKIYSYDYFVQLFEICRDSKGYTEQSLADLSDPELICSFWNYFWFTLPDNMSIQRQPFNSICDICEYDYRDETEVD